MQYSGIEICRIGIEIEHNGQLFYNKASLMVEEGPLRSLLQKLANDEVQHEAVYRRILGELEAQQEQPDECCFDEHYDAYIKALADARVFTDNRTVEKVLSRIDGPVDILETAMGFEKDAIMYLSEMLNVVTEKDKAIIADLIGYEKEHLRILSERKAELLAK